MLQVWRNNICEHILQELLVDIMNEITSQRELGTLTTQSSADISSAIKSFIDLGLDGHGELEYYKKQFEEPFLQHISNYYTKFSDSYLEKNSIPDYTVKVEKILKFEGIFAKQFLHGNSEFELIHVCQTNLVGVHLSKFFIPFKNILSSATEKKDLDGTFLFLLYKL